MIVVVIFLAVCGLLCAVQSGVELDGGGPATYRAWRFLFLALALVGAALILATIGGKL